ncbi:MAG: rlmCD, partial [Haloplasmataceae bacterium]|nr:rlmCD [Haloplasmataceae bacterium]
MKINEIINIKCISINEEGLGIVKNNDQIIHVPHLLVGEEAQIKIISKNKENIYFGEIVKVIKSSPHRIKPKCGIYEQCGGCHFQHMSYAGQLEHKKSYVENVMKNIGKINVKVNDTIGMENPDRYRNKIQIAFGSGKKGEILAGFYQEKSHHIVSMDTCLIQDEKADQIILSIKKIMHTLKFRPYNEDTKNGLIRHVLVKRGFHTDQTMVVIVTSQDEFPGRSNFVKALREAHPDINTIVQNTNSRSTSIVLGDKERVLFGKGYIEDTLLGLKFKISPKSFYQVNPVQTEILYDKAIEYANLKGQEIVLDAYCGIGTIGLIASKNAKQVIGVEVNGDAIKDAINNAKSNNITNTRFYNSDASDFMVDLANNKQKMDVVFIDPPRKGCDQKFLDSLVKLKPEKVVYISCDPSTQARDLNFLVKYYNVKEIQPVDMF